LPGEIVPCPTVRDPDGLALSSRNARLSKADRELALAIPRSIDAVRQLAARGETDARRLESAGMSELVEPGVAVDYFAVVDSNSLEAIDRLRPGSRAIAAAEIGGIRLIDNAEIEASRSADG
jgi:pantoate--beta-alanine ligase